MADSVQTRPRSLVQASELATTLTPRAAANGVRFVAYGNINVQPAELERVVAAVPLAMQQALADRVFYFVPLAIPESRGNEGRAADASATLIAGDALPELFDEAICHRNVSVGATFSLPAHEGVFISARLLRDTFALAFEFFINVGHAFTQHAGIPDSFTDLLWKQALSDVRGETSQDAWESRQAALAPRTKHEPGSFDEKARTEYYESAFADALAIYQLSLAVDFDYAELREREYPLLAPAALADRLKLVAALFPPNPGYTFSIRYRRR